MNALKGAVIQCSELPEAVKVADLIYFEGPIVSLFRNHLSENLLFLWCDRTEQLDRWLVVKVTDETLASYLEQRISLRAVVMEPRDRFVYVADVGANWEFNTVMIVSPTELTSDYLPSENSIYCDEPILSRGLPEERVPIAGDWSFEDFSDFPNLYKACYSLIYLAENKKIGGQFHQFPMNDGFSSVHFFNEIRFQVPREDRPDLKVLRYASPGAIVFNAEPHVALAFKSIYRNFRENAAAAITSYNATHKMIRELGLLAEDAKRTKLPAEVESTVLRIGTAFAQEIKFPGYEIVVEKAGNPLMAIKVILAFFRRVRRMSVYEDDGKIKMPLLS